MNRSVVIGFICIVAIVAAGAFIFMRPKSPEAQARYEAGWRKCAVCGHEWNKDPSQLIRESKASEDGSGFVRCPKCGAWRGMPIIRCPHCGKNYTSHKVVEDERGVYFPKQRTCPYCGRGLAEAVGSQGQPADTD
jgi:uncharacterized C2H2 Zn-finger protein